MDPDTATFWSSFERLATIHKRKLTSGEVVWELTHGTGSDRVRFIAGRTHEEAQATLTQFDRQLALHGAAAKNESITSTVGQYEQFLKTNRRPATVVRYMRVVRTFVDCFLAKYHVDVDRLRQLRPMHLEEYKRRRSEGTVVEAKSEEVVRREQELRQQLAQRSGTKMSAEDRAKFGWLAHRSIKARVSQRTINYELRVLFTLFLWAIRHNYLFFNPAATVERFRLPKRALPKFMTADELKKSFAVCDDCDRRLFMTILLTGMRKGEAEYLTWPDVGFELAVIFIQEKPELHWKPKTDERLIPISPIVHGILLEQFEHRRSEVFVFANSNGNRDTHILERLKRNCVKAGIRSSTVHALRHSFGTHLRMAGASLADIADLLGHKDLATTQIYAKVQQEHLRLVVAKLNALVDRQAPAASTARLLPEASATTTQDN